MAAWPGTGLLERDAELAAIARLLAAAEGAAGAAMRVEGPPGIGKSRLLAAARGAADHAGLRVLSARASDLERDFGFGVVRQLFEPVLARAGADERAALLGGAAALAATVLEMPGPGGDAAEEATPAALHGLYWLCAGLAEQRPLLLCVDDLHWADRPSLRWLVYLLQRLEGLRVAVLAGVRPGEGRHAPELLEAIAAHPLVATLRPAPLSEDGVARLIAAASGGDVAPPFAAACHRATGGNPFLVEELVQGLADRELSPAAASPADVADVSPAAVRRSVEARLRRLPPACGALAVAVAVLGDGTELAAAARFAGLEAGEAVAAAEALAAVHVLDAGAAPAFVHPVVRAAVRANLAQGELAAAHLRAARQLRTEGASPDRIALHLLNAPPAGDGRVVEDLRAAARDALARGAPELAARLLRRALREPPAADVTRDMLLELGAAEMGAAEMERSLEHLSRAVELSAEPAARGAATLALAGVLLRMSRGPDAHDALARALPGTDGELRARLEGVRLQAAYASPRAYAAYGAAPPPGVPRGEVPRTLGERIDHGRQSLWESLHGTAAAAREHAHAAWGAGELLDALGPTDPTTALAVTAQLWADDLDSAIARLTAIVEESRRRGSVRGFVAACHFRAIGWWRRGALLELEADAGNALEHGAPYGLPLAAPFLAMALLERGQVAAAHAALERALPDGDDLPAVALFALEARARVDVAQRRPDAARVALGRAEALERAYGLQGSGISQWRAVAAPLWHAAGAEETARALARKWVAAMEAYGAPRAIGVARTTLAAVGPPEQRIGQLEAAVAVLRGASARLDLARALVELGAALRRERRRGEAREPLREGQELALRAGATVLARRADQELAAAGEQPRHSRPEQRDELTAHELRVAHMAADGMTNREIAQSLFVTQKTIEAHLSSVYRKLDIRSRVQLVRALSEPEAVGA